MIPKVFFSINEDRNIVYEVPGLRERIMQSLQVGKRYFEEIKRYRKNRSAEQNSYMWGVVYKLMSDETGYTPDEIHQLMGERFLSYEKNGIKFIQSTTKLFFTSNIDPF